MGTTEGGRTVHDGFATIRSGGSKRARAVSSPSVGPSSYDSRGKGCSGCCRPPAPRTGAMEPLWEERNGVALNPKGTEGASVPRRDSKVPWWEVATRRSRYRSCPAFSQANLVSALEQTVSDVSERLERLASSPDLKSAEAEEIRKSVAVLRRQSSAVSQSVSSGYLSLERQASCDSVSSVSSTISAGSHCSFCPVGGGRGCALAHPNIHISSPSHKQCEDSEENTTKIKKRSWIRASFRRAFGKSNRKRTKQTESPFLSDLTDKKHIMALTSSNGYEHLGNGRANGSVPHQLTGSMPSRTTSAVWTNHHTRGSSNCGKLGKCDHADHCSKCRQCVLEKDRALMESRMDLLSTQSKVQSQADLISQLQNEISTLREEISRLSELLSEALSKNKEGGGVGGLSTDFNSLVLSHIQNSLSGYETLTFPPSAGRKVRAQIVRKSSVPSAIEAATLSLKELEGVNIGWLTILPRTSWQQLDKLVADLFEDYLGFIDPATKLGITSCDILCYRVAESLRADGIPRPDLLPFGYCVGDHELIYVWLKGPMQTDASHPAGNPAAVAFANCTPSSCVKNFLEVLQESKRIVLAGPPSSGKSTLGHEIAMHYILNRKGSTTDNSIFTFRVTGTNSLDLCQLLNSVWPHGLQPLSSGGQGQESSSVFQSFNPLAVHTSPEIIIIDDLHAAAGVVETMQRCLPAASVGGPAIIAILDTSQQNPGIVTRLQLQCGFKWLSLLPQEEPFSGFLRRSLRKVIVDYEISSETKQAFAYNLAEWVCQLWSHINSCLVESCGQEWVIGPRTLSSCPVLCTKEAQDWLVSTWNRILVPHMLNALTISGASQNVSCNWTDPKLWALSTCPWDDKDAVLSHLRSVNMPETNARQKRPCSPVTRRSMQRSFQTFSKGRNGTDSIYATPFSSTSPSKSCGVVSSGVNCLATNVECHKVHVTEAIPANPDGACVVRTPLCETPSLLEEWPSDGPSKEREANVLSDDNIFKNYRKVGQNALEQFSQEEGKLTGEISNKKHPERLTESYGLSCSGDVGLTKESVSAMNQSEAADIITIRPSQSTIEKVIVAQPRAYSNPSVRGLTNELTSTFKGRRVVNTFC